MAPPVVAADLTTILPYIREKTSAALDDLFDGVTYWTDDQLAELANNNTVYSAAYLRVMSTDELTYSVQVPKHWWLIASDAVKIYNDDTLVTTSYTYYNSIGVIVFDEETTVTHLEGFFINMLATIADIWESKAAHRAKFVNMKVGSATKVDMSQEYEHCMRMSQYYRNKIARRFSRT